MYQLTFSYVPPQAHQLSPSIAPEATAGSVYANTSGSIRSANLAIIRSSWAQEGWGAQTGAHVASQLATPSVTATVFCRTYFTYAVQGWPTQRLIGGGVGATIAASTVTQQIPAVNSAANATVRGLWPEPQWDAQAEPTVASIFAMVANPPSIDPYPVAALQAGVRGIWPVEDWRGQSESAIASGIANAVPPPNLVPAQAAFAALLAGGAIWPRETWASQNAPHSLAWLPAPITAIPAPVSHTERLSWPQEAWNAQTGAVVAARLATITQQIPPRLDTQAAIIRSSWGQESWSAQESADIAGMLSQVKPPTFVNNPPLSAAIFYQLVQSWPQPDWYTQSEDNVGSQVAQAIPTATLPTPFSRTLYVWALEGWYTQTENNVASLVAQQQVPPLYTPYSRGAIQISIAGIWPQEYWKAQTGPLGAAWISEQQPVTPIQTPPPHIERLVWPQEAWAAQSGATVASRLASPVAIQPAPPAQRAIALLWPRETWNAQEGANIASQVAPAFEVPFVPTPLRFTEILAWPRETWAAQTPPRIASELAAVPVSVVPVAPAAGRTIRSIWPQEDWGSQKGPRNAAAFAVTTPAVPFLSVPTRAQLISSWPQEAWKAQAAPSLAYLFAAVQPPPPTPTPTRVVQPPSNLGYKVTTRNFSLLEMVTRQWGGEFRAPDHRVYVWSNDRAFDSTDMTSNGIYRKP